MPTRKFATDIDLLSAFSIRNALLNPVSTDPTGLGSGQAGMVWFNTVGGKLKVWTGSAAVDFLDRSNHTGSQLASTISDLITTIRAQRLDQLAAPTADVPWGSRKITGLADGSGANDAINKGQLDAALAALTSGQILKGAVTVAATTNVNVASPGATIDGITLTSGVDLVLLTGQSTASQNGPYLFNGASSPLTRAANFDTSGEAAIGSYWVVEQGTKADNYALMTNDTAVTLGTTALAFSFIGSTSFTAGNGISISGGVITAVVAAGGGVALSGSGLALDPAVASRHVVGVIPTATSGIFTVSGSVVTINHGLGSTAPDFVLRAGSSPASGYTTGQRVEVEELATDLNNLQVTLPAAPASNNWVFQIEV